MRVKITISCEVELNDYRTHRPLELAAAFVRGEADWPDKITLQSRSLSGVVSCLQDADPHCEHELVATPTGGSRCLHCSAH